eukprot:1273003-Amphidinium_carterae.3
MSDDSVAASKQKSPERSEQSQTCCKWDAFRMCEFRDRQHMSRPHRREWFARDPSNNQWCCNFCMPRATSVITARGMALKCYSWSVRMQHAVIMCVAFTHIGAQYRCMQVRDHSSE